MGRRDRRIAFYTNPTFTHGRVGWSPDDEIIGGTEESVVEWAKRLKARGYDVVVYTNGRHGIWDGVAYAPHSDYTLADVTIAVNNPVTPLGRKTFWLTNQVDAADYPNDYFDGIILASKYAFDKLGVRHHNVRVLPHGYDADDIYPETKIRNQCLYASSPDRGLSTLLELWPEVARQVPDATLIVTYGGSGPSLPNVIYTGQVNNGIMSRLYRSSDFWVHTCSGGELFCMSGIKAQVAQAIPVFFPVMALRETVRHGIRTNRNNFVREIVSIMRDDERKVDFRRLLRDEHYADWDDSTDILETIIDS